MNTHTSRAWLFSLVLLASCAASAEPPTGSDDSNVGRKNDTPAAPAPAPSSSTPYTAPIDTPAPSPSSTDTPVEQAPPVLKVLNIVWQRQETGYWCGPGSTRMVISTREEKLPSQTTLAEELGTTTNGTDHISQMVTLLNARWKLTGADAYVARDIYDPPTAAQRALLKADVVKRINAGYGIVVNVISGWRPPGYPTSGTIYHYVAAIGYDQSGDKVLIADPAAEGSASTAWSQVPRTYWVDIDDLGTWIGGKGYTG